MRATSSSIGSTRAGAPPCSGPERAPHGRRHRRAGVRAGGRDDPRGEGRGVEPVLGGADPVGVDRLDVLRVGLPAPAEQELLGGGLALGDDVLRHAVGLAVRDAGRLGDDRDHLRREPGEVVARLLRRDVDELLQRPLAREPRRLGLQVGGRVAAQVLRLVGLRIGHPRLEALVHQQAPDLLVVVVADELLDVHAAIAERAALAVGLCDLRLEGDDPFEPRLELVHGRKSTGQGVAWRGRDGRCAQGL